MQDDFPLFPVNIHESRFDHSESNASLSQGVRAKGRHRHQESVERERHQGGSRHGMGPEAAKVIGHEKRILFCIPRDSSTFGQRKMTATPTCMAASDYAARLEPLKLACSCCTANPEIPKLLWQHPAPDPESPTPNLCTGRLDCSRPGRRRGRRCLGSARAGACGGGGRPRSRIRTSTSSSSRKAREGFFGRAREGTAPFWNKEDCNFYEAEPIQTKCVPRSVGLNNGFNQLTDTAVCVPVRTWTDRGHLNRRFKSSQVCYQQH